MTTVQKSLFDELEEVSKKIPLISRPIILTNDDLVASDDGIIFPCLIARRLPVEERPAHMNSCDACKRLERELDEHIGIYQEHGVWY